LGLANKKKNKKGDPALAGLKKGLKTKKVSESVGAEISISLIKSPFQIKLEMRILILFTFLRYG